ncbi:PepSY domain-containing protein [Streptosporangium carneum]|uniref:PepSY domain-containing protein n=1 Tax=Streptosporangium carneum TaxID=47481 RepID=A0A9W6MGB2_9ACTN|nr:PepSY domain-containing protein [Streptosporangium carneum]GLK12987.1 hypothetical protein GCM10017600_63970 [Streptosporangium carneum]
MRNTTKLTLATAGFLAVVAGGGAAFAVSASPAPSSSGTTATPAPTSTTAPAEQAPRTPAPGEAEAKVQRDAAVKIAQDKAPGAQLTKAEFDGDETPAVWEVEFRQGDVEHDFEIDASTGAILEHEQETETAEERKAEAAEDQAGEQDDD